MTNLPYKTHNSGRVRHMLKSAALAVIVATTAGGAPALAESCTTAAPANDTGTVWWNELLVSDPDRSRGFYEKVIGWKSNVVSSEDTSRPPKEGEQNYTIFQQNGQETAGLMKIANADPTGMRPGWLAYVQVENVDSAVLAAMQEGGKILKAPFNSPGSGRIAIIADPQGIPLGLVTPIAKSAIR
jgi:uncharacterized protein